MGESKMVVKAEHLSGTLAGSFPKLMLALGGLGLGLSAVFFKLHPHHMAFSYLTAFVFFLTIALGGFFFVLIQYLTRAGWSVAVRRVPEHHPSHESETANTYQISYTPLPLLLLPPQPKSQGN